MNWLFKMLKKYNAWLTTDPVIWKTMKSANKKGKKCNLVAGWKNGF